MNCKFCRKEITNPDPRAQYDSLKCRDYNNRLKWLLKVRARLIASSGAEMFPNRTPAA